MARFDPGEPVALAGSDLVNFFLYERLPRRRIELIVASNNAAFGARPVRAAIAQVLGLPSDDGARVAASAPRANAHPPAPAVAAMLTDLVNAINAADSSRVARFVADHFLAEPGAPSAEERVTRLLAIHQNLGALTVNGLDQIEPGVVEASVATAQEGAATMKFMLDTSPSPKIKGIQMLVGG